MRPGGPDPVVRCLPDGASTKRDLVRVVRTPGGQMTMDETGRLRRQGCLPLSATPPAASVEAAFVVLDLLRRRGRARVGLAAAGSASVVVSSLALFARGLRSRLALDRRLLAAASVRASVPSAVASGSSVAW